MTESILKAILRLYALIAQLNKSVPVNTTRGIVESYLRQLVSPEQVRSYLIIYDFYYRGYKESRDKLNHKLLSVYSVKALIICEQINTVLEQKQKALILVNLLDLVNLNEETPPETIDFLKTIGSSFHFNDNIFYNCEKFVLRQIDAINLPEKVLLITQDPTIDKYSTKFIHKDFLSGEIILLYISEINTILFRYLGDTEQLYLNGRDILPNRTYVLHKGSSIRSPKLSPIYYSDISNKFVLDSEEPSITLFAHNVRFRFTNSENGIYPFNFYERSGSLIGIMGGSGVGKSTLLNVMNGSLKPNEGEILINGYDLYKEADLLEGTIGFIPQDDLLIEELTVYQNLYFNARLCFSNLNESEIQQTVNKVLSDLDLFEVKDLTVGNPLNKFISGGQRKRVNIALELLREPSVLFVDEPTSGLSSRDSDVVMELLKEQTKRGKLVIVNIHQPSSDIFKMFDKLLMLDKGGRVIYQGNPIDAISYFKKQNQLINSDESECLSCGNVNPEQLLQIIEEKEINAEGKKTNKRIHSPKEWYDLYQKNIEPKIKTNFETHPTPKSKFSVPNRISQFKIFLQRTLLSKIADKQYLLINFLEAPLLAIILGLFTRYNAGSPENPTAYIFSKNENLPVYLFMAVVVAIFLGLMVSAEEIIKDRKILKREAFLNLKRSSYINSKVFMLLIISAIQTFSFVLVGNTILEIKGMYFSYWLVLFASAFFANILGLIISSTLRSVVSIYILIPVLLVPQILLGGAMLKFDKLNKDISTEEYVPVVGDIMTSRWAYEALSVHQFTKNMYQQPLYNIEQKESEFSFIINYRIPEIQSLLSRSKNNIKNNVSHKETEINLDIIRYEMNYLIEKYHLPEFYFLRQMSINSFDLNIADEGLIYLKQSKRYFTKILQETLTEKDAVLSEISATIGRDKLLEYRDTYFNESLANIVLNKDEKDKIKRSNNKLIQKAEPIFNIPELTNGRAHFYAPVKKIGAYLFDTYWFNVAIIFFITFVLYLVLIFNLINRLHFWISSLNVKTYIRKKLSIFDSSTYYLKSRHEQR